MTAPKHRTIRQHYFLRATPAKVFRAIAQPELLSQWWVAQASLEPRKGGGYALTWAAGYRHQGKVLEFVRGRRLTLAFSYREVVGLPDDTRLELSVRPKAGGTLLTLKHSGFPADEAWIDVYAGSAAAWAYYFANLKSVIENGKDLRSKHDWTE